MDLQKKYIEEAVPKMQEEFAYQNVMNIPKIQKVIVHVGVGRLREKKEHEEIQEYLKVLTGQKPSSRPAKKAIAAFKTREGMVLGYAVTLRGQRMHDFLSRLVNIALPRTRDFQGLNHGAFDAQGNLTIGIKEHIVFPEMIGEEYDVLFGMEITVVTTARTQEEGRTLLKLMGFPIKEVEQAE